MISVDVVRSGSNIELQRTRQLPLPGQVLVKEGDEVAPEDVIAETTISSGIRLVNLYRALNLSSEEVEGCLVREVGDTLEEGDVIAQAEGVIPRLVRAPADGILLDVNDGQAVLAADETIFRVQSGVIGRIQKVIPEYGAVIQTRGSLIQGMWGNGKVGQGALRVLIDKQEGLLDAADLDEVEKGDLLAGGVCLNGTVLVTAVEREAAGIIVIRLAPELIPTALDMAIPVIVVGGFGPGLPDQRTVDILRLGAGKMACVNAVDVDRSQGHRPEVIIPQEDGKAEELLGFQGVIEVGMQVRLLSGEFVGRVGEVEACAKSPVEFPSGLELPSVLIRLENGEAVSASSQNLVILG